jgi:predicted AAA+ superfamily ATPase
VFHRIAIERLIKWSESPTRKPLVLRGARQVGKTTLVNLFAKNFDEFISLNLDKPAEKEIFENNKSTTELVGSLFFLKNIPLDATNVLIFIDEIQNSSKAVEWLRYLYEEAPQYHVIAAGSLLESLIDNQISFPVGRVSYMPIRPFTFAEFVLALDEKQSSEILKIIPTPDYAHDKLSQLFRTYTLIGGMPEIIKNYAVTRDVMSLTPIYDELLASYKDDVEKYAKSKVNAQSLQHVINHIFREAGSRITYQGFGNSNYKSREMREAFFTLEKAFLLNLIFPATNTEIPLSPNYRKSPKLQVVDTGFINFVSGIQKDFFGIKDLSDVYRGRIAEHITGQELAALNYTISKTSHFWTREKNADAEVDFVYPFNNLVIPIEVKSGKAGKLRSLNEFMERTNHSYAVRVYSERLSITESKTRTGKRFYLLNLPFYLVHKIEKYLKWFVSEVT